MSSAFDSIKLGLQEAINHAKDHEPDTRIHRPTVTIDPRHLSAVHESGITRGKPSRAMDGA